MPDELFVSVIVPTYKDPIALKLILDALNRQTYRHFEVIVAEDDNVEETRELLGAYKAFYPIKHFSQEDRGLRKARAVNSAVRMSDGEYLIYIDGDTIPYTTFVEGHVRLAEPKRALCGRRVNVGAKVSKMLREGTVTSEWIERHYWRAFFLLKEETLRDYAKGIHIRPNSLLYRLMASFDTNVHILASNFSCYKSDMAAINGSDEAMPGGPGVDDTDVEWRLEAIGVKMKTCKYSANLLHLDHPRSERAEAYAQNLKRIAEKKRDDQWYAPKGIVKDQSS